MKSSPIAKLKKGAALIEYGVIAMFVAGAVLVSSQVLDSTGFAPMNEMMLNAATDTGEGNAFKAD